MVWGVFSQAQPALRRRLYSALLSLLLLLAFAPALFSLSLVAPDGTIRATPSLETIPLAVSCREFWTPDAWNTSWLVSRNPILVIYSTDAHQAPAALESLAWTPGSTAAMSTPGATSAASELMKKARRRALEAQDAYREEERQYGLARIDWGKLAASAGTAFVGCGSAAVPAGLTQVAFGAMCAGGLLSTGQQLKAPIDYPSKWQASVRASGDSLSLASQSADLAFQAAQASADNLTRMGAGDPYYSGGAKQIWQDWDLFAADALRYSKDSSLSIPAAAGSDALDYARTYRTLQRIQQLCDRPADPMPFNDSGSPAQAFNSLASDGEGTLWARAWDWRARLDLAVQQMEVERQNAQDEANDSLKQADSLMMALARADWSDDYALPARSLDELLSGSPTQWQALGTYSARLSAAQDMHSQAKAAQLASQSIRPGQAFWAARSMAAYRNVSAFSSAASLRAGTLLSDLNASVRQARGQAQGALDALDAQLQTRLASDQPEATASARAQLKQAQKSLQSGDDQDEGHLGARYAHYAQALSDASFGSSLLDRSKGLGANLTRMKHLLEEFRIRLSWAPALGVDVSDFQDGYDNFYAELGQGLVKNGSLDALHAQISALNSRLAEGLAAEDRHYEHLEALAKATLPYYPSALSQWRADMGVWRLPSGAWSDQALKNPDGLRAQLLASRTRLEAQRPLAIAKALCASADWMPLRTRSLAANERADLGGVWRARNGLAIGQPAPLELTCPFAPAFGPSELSNRSAWVESAWSSDGRLHVSLNGIGPGDEVMLAFSSPQMPASFSTKSCTAEASAQGLTLRSIHTLRALYAPEELEVSLPWDSGLPLASARLSSAYNGSVQGEWADSGLRPLLVSFMLTRPGTSGEWASEMRAASPPAFTRASLSASAGSGGPVNVSYVLEVGGLPTCDEVLLHVAEPSDGISSLRARPSDSDRKVQLEETPLPGFPYWSARVSPVPAGAPVRLLVSYAINDSAQWVNLTLPLLQSRASAENNSDVQALVSRARSQAAASDWAGAVQTIEQARALLEVSSSPPVPLSEAVRFNQTLADADALYAQLSNLSVLVRGASERPGWANDVADWRNQLQTLSDQLRASAISSSLPSTRTLQTLTDRVRNSLLDSAEKDYFTLSNSLNALRGLDSAAASDASLAAADRSLLLARERLQAEDGPGALEMLLSARASAQSYQSALHARQRAAASSQSKRAAALSDEVALTQEELDAYLASLAQLDSAGSHAFAPALSLSAAKSLSTELRKAAPSTDSSALPDDFAQAAKLLASRETALQSASQALAKVRAPLTQGMQSLQAGANRTARLIDAYLAEIHASPTLSASPAASALDSDYANLQDMMANAQWPDAIVAGESILLRAKRLVESAPPAASEPPWAMIGLTLLLAAGIAFLLLRGKPPKAKGHVQAAPKTLAKMAGV